MDFLKTSIPDVVLIKPHLLRDNRGYFAETFREDLLEDSIGFKVNFCQDNETKSKRNVLRGLHFQLPPYAQSKLVRVIEGEVLDVVVDIREGSPTFSHHFSVRLSSENKKQLFIPRGFAHGFLVLSEIAIFSYKVDNFYSSEYSRGVAFNDTSLGIKWNLPLDQLILSEEDSKQPLLKEISKECSYFNYKKNLYD